MKAKHVVAALVGLAAIIGVYLIYSQTVNTAQGENSPEKITQSAQAAPPAKAPAAPAAPAQAAPPAAAPAAPEGESQPDIILGRDYTQVAKPMRLYEDPKDEVELVYMFWYGCGTCRALDPIIKQYEANIPKGVKLWRIPALYAQNEYWMAHGRLFYTLTALGKEEELHQAIFETVQGASDSSGHSHEAGGLVELNSMLNFAEKHGISRQDFMQAWDSKEVKDNLDRALAFIDNLDINSVPAMAVDGRYAFIITRKGPGFFLATAELLINKEKESMPKAEGVPEKAEESPQDKTE